MEELLQRMTTMLDELSSGNVIDHNMASQQLRIGCLRDLIEALEARMDTLRMRSYVHHHGVEAERMAKSLWEKA